MLDQDQTEATETAQLPRNKDGSIRKTFVKSVARRIEAGGRIGPDARWSATCTKPTWAR